MNTPRYAVRDLIKLKEGRAFVIVAASHDPSKPPKLVIEQLDITHRTTGSIWIYPDELEPLVRVLGRLLEGLDETLMGVPSGIRRRTQTPVRGRWKPPLTP